MSAYESLEEFENWTESEIMIHLIRFIESSSAETVYEHLDEIQKMNAPYGVLAVRKDADFMNTVCQYLITPMAQKHLSTDFDFINDRLAPTRSAVEGYFKDAKAFRMAQIEQVIFLQAP